MAKRTNRARGRGTDLDPVQRFEPIHFELDAEHATSDVARTEYLCDRSRSVISRNQSPDVPFEVSLNPYRGCEHGCIYCYARPTHEYLGLSCGLDFETRILVKPEAPALLARALSLPSWKPQLLALSGVTDPYQPVEQRLGLTRACLEVLAEHRQPVGLITKGTGVVRDIDILQKMAHARTIHVTLSVTTLDPEVARHMEPRAAQPMARLRAIESLASAGVPVGVNIAPCVPGLTDHEIPRILEASARAGARWASLLMLRLPHGVQTLFLDWLERHLPDRRGRVVERIREVRGGQLDDARFGSRMRGQGLYCEQLRRLFVLWRTRLGLTAHPPELDSSGFRRPPRSKQMELF